MLGEAAAPLDGRVIALASFPAFITAVHDCAPRYRLDSFAHAGMLTDEPYRLFVGGASPFRSLADLAAAARVAPEAISIAGAGEGGAPQFALMQLERLAGIRFTWVPDAGGGAGAGAGRPCHGGGLGRQPHGQAVPGGGGADPRADGYRALGRVPEMPTFREQCFDAVAGAARGPLLPAATPVAAQRRLAEAIARMAADPASRALAERDFVIVRHLGPVAMRAFAEAEDRRYAALWRAGPWRQRESRGNR